MIVCNLLGVAQDLISNISDALKRRTLEALIDIFKCAQVSTSLSVLRCLQEAESSHKYSKNPIISTLFPVDTDHFRFLFYFPPTNNLYSLAYLWRSMKKRSLKTIHILKCCRKIAISEWMVYHWYVWFISALHVKKWILQICGFQWFQFSIAIKDLNDEDRQKPIDSSIHTISLGIERCRTLFVFCF